MTAGGKQAGGHPAGRLQAGLLFSRTAWLLQRWSRKLWVRAAAFSGVAVLLALFSAYAAPFLPDDVTLKLAAGSVDDILHILASSMLAVAIFSLSIMVATYAAATSNATPRSIKLLVADPVAQNALATFVGIFLYSMVGMIGLAAGLYDDKGRILLFGATLVVLVIIAATLLRWIGQLGQFGRVGDMIARVEDAATKAARQWGRLSQLGAHPAVALPSGAAPVTGRASGYLQHIDMRKLADLAAQADVVIHLQVLPGAFVHPARTLVYVSRSARPGLSGDVEACFTVGPNRQYEQDPRFGLIVLAEIASRALSPAVNDPGTAIEVIGAGTRVLMAHAAAVKEAPCFARIHASDLSTADLFDDFFNPIARDGAAMIEVHMRLQAVLQALAQTHPAVFEDMARRHAAIAAERANEALRHDHDRKMLRERAAWRA